MTESDMTESTISEFYCSRNDRVRQKYDDRSIKRSPIINFFKRVHTVHWGSGLTTHVGFFSEIQKMSKTFLNINIFENSLLEGEGSKNIFCTLLKMLIQ